MIFRGGHARGSLSRKDRARGRGFFESIKRGRRDFWDKYARAREGGAVSLVLSFPRPYARARVLRVAQPISRHFSPGTSVDQAQAAINKGAKALWCGVAEEQRSQKWAG